ncbi:SDR family NAD(P)-dependent oxidoreductase [Nocardia bhagyanarayanae]|uniref:NAD(P)-dependent dehydrogenase (Short-subunit alcohol dehydrogenase family) n=1 Tax=Nocardia bhagyanarayanae TaxID=1215925 RepID=A0A543FCY9_9NOCA|nr:SDR family NAD(P)-dependent oxidoreductase [Nocardia bhagyanarayanae]TQM31740.1 NAD(P)-dependent dehydrogenase (short-subunit alcohol dehydrogenase family) [Nocardia bhagyanarayanae]
MSKIAIVTGGNQGLGLALVRGLCRTLPAGSTVYLTARDPDRGAAAVALLEAEGLRPAFEVLDVSDDSSVRAAAERIATRHGGVDIVISNAAARISPELDNASQVRGFVDTNNHGTRRMLDAFLPRLRDGARYVVVASFFGTLTQLDPRLWERFDRPGICLGDIDRVMDEYVDAVEAGRAADEGWPEWINVPSKVGQVAAARIAARDLPPERDILVNAACPGLVDTDASRPWFDNMDQALSADDAAIDVNWLATLPAGTTEPRGELVQYRKVIPFR